MPSTKKPPAKNDSIECEMPASSPGDNPVELVPKDIPCDAAAARDLTERPIASPDPEVREEALLDDAIEDTFPASDPIAVPSYDAVAEKKKAEKKKAGT
jgi:hypothetical protein